MSGETLRPQTGDNYKQLLVKIFHAIVFVNKKELKTNKMDECQNIKILYYQTMKYSSQGKPGTKYYIA